MIYLPSPVAVFATTRPTIGSAHYFEGRYAAEAFAEARGGLPVVESSPCLWRVIDPDTEAGYFQTADDRWQGGNGTPPVRYSITPPRGVRT